MVETDPAEETDLDEAVDALFDALSDARIVQRRREHRGSVDERMMEIANGERPNEPVDDEPQLEMALKHIEVAREAIEKEVQ